MTQKLIFYFHGMHSSPNTPKVARLKEVFPDTYAFPIEVDPDQSLPYLQDQIDLILLDAKYMHLPNLEIIFIGTSLGAWYAAELADKYKAKAILINPSYDPYHSLEKYGIQENIRIKYPPIKWLNDAIYYIAKNDEVIDFLPVKSILEQLTTHWIDNADHSFSGKEFDMIIQDIKNEKLQLC
jgi:hypothetical protein